MLSPSPPFAISLLFRGGDNPTSTPHPHSCPSLNFRILNGGKRGCPPPVGKRRMFFLHCGHLLLPLMWPCSSLSAATARRTPRERRSQRPPVEVEAPLVRPDLPRTEGTEEKKTENSNIFRRQNFVTWLNFFDQLQYFIQKHDGLSGKNIICISKKNVLPRIYEAVFWAYLCMAVTGFHPDLEFFLLFSFPILFYSLSVT